jgi:hypothetical protein
LLAAKVLCSRNPTFAIALRPARTIAVQRAQPAPVKSAEPARSWKHPKRKRI